MEDFSTFCEGDLEPTLNKKIQTIIIASADYIVYVDQNNYVQWSYTDKKTMPKGFGLIANRVGYLESLSRILLRKS